MPAAAIKTRPIPFSAPMVRAILEGRKKQTRRVVKPQPHHGEEVGWYAGEPWHVHYSLHGRNTTDFLCPYGRPGDRQGTFFRDASPTETGWYDVRWEPGDDWIRVWLNRVHDEPHDDPVEHDVERWVWGKGPTDDPESVCLDIRDPLLIEWKRPGDRLYVRETTCIAPKNFATPDDSCIPDSDGDLRYVSYKADGHPEDAMRDYGLKWTPAIHVPRWASRITLEVTGVRVESLQEITEADAIYEGFEPREWREGWPDTSSGDNLNHMTAKACFRETWEKLNANRGFPWETNPFVWVVSFQRVEGSCRNQPPN